MEENKQIIEVPLSDIAVSRAPKEVLMEASNAAKALTEVISKKKKPVIFNGQHYLEFEDWQTIGRFYGISSKIVSSNFVEMGEVKGFEAHAIAIQTATGKEVSAADSVCLNDEPNWSRKPMFQLKSMAQTRACAKALRNVLAWVVVLGGFGATPAEEMDSVINGNKEPRKITEAQRKRLFAISRNTDKTDEQIKDYLMDKFGIESTKDILMDDYEEICDWIQS